LAKLLKKAVEGTLTRDAMYEIIREKGFEESILTIPEALDSGAWPLLKEDLSTPLEHAPTMPLTTLQKRWLKAMLLDPRIRLFLDPAEVMGLEDTEPLFRQEDVYYYDRYSDGDPYEDPAYIANFRNILTAIRENRWLEVRRKNRCGEEVSQIVKPLYLEYSPRDDKFRLHSAGTKEHIWLGTIQTNVGRIQQSHILDYEDEPVLLPAQRQQAELILSDCRGLLDRFMRLFCWLEKKTVPMEPVEGTMRYHVTLYYEKTDEPELVIRLLSMGPDIEILSPASLKQEILRRVKKQTELLKQ
jgi:hypothetical protein